MDGRLSGFDLIRATDGRADLEPIARELAREQAASIEDAGVHADRDAFVESVRDLVMERTRGHATQRLLPLSDPRLHEPFDVSQRVAAATSRIIASRA